MISDSDRYYGAVFNRIFDRLKKAASVEKIRSVSAGFFLLNDRLPIYIKYSTNRRSPWHYTFHRQQQKDQQILFERYGECIVVFVCGKDGIASLCHTDFRKVLDHEFDEQESVSIRRRHNEMYKIKGKDGSYERKVARNSLERLLEKERF